MQHSVFLLIKYIARSVFQGNYVLLIIVITLYNTWFVGYHAPVVLPCRSSSGHNFLLCMNWCVSIGSNESNSIKNQGLGKVNKILNSM